MPRLAAKPPGAPVIRQASKEAAPNFLSRDLPSHKISKAHLANRGLTSIKGAPENLATD
jgi:hypothetical protein